MNIISAYYYAGVPILTCNVLLYSLTTLSNSITSSQNVVKFMSEHKESDIDVYHRLLSTSNISCNLKIMEEILHEIFTKNSKYYKDLKMISATLPIALSDNEFDEFKAVEMVNIDKIIDTFPTSLKTSIADLISTINEIKLLLNTINASICQNKTFFTISKKSIKNEVKKLDEQILAFNSKFQMFFQLCNLCSVKI